MFLNVIVFHPCFAGLSCRPSARASGTWSTVPFATERCPSSSSSLWWTAPCSSARRDTTRSSMTFRVTYKVRLDLAFHQNLFTLLWSSSTCVSKLLHRLCFKTFVCADVSGLYSLHNKKTSIHCHFKKYGLKTKSTYWFVSSQCAASHHTFKHTITRHAPS